jgi:hypothetical protein
MQSQIRVETRGIVKAAPDCRSARGDIPQKISHLEIRLFYLGMQEKAAAKLEAILFGR